MAKPRQKYNPNIIKPEDASMLREEIRNIYELRNRLEVVTTNPDGSRSGIKGDMLLLDDSGTYYLEVNTDSGTTWRGEALSDTP